MVSENVQVISDAPMPKPLNGFNALSQVLTNVIKKSESRFTIGIYGEWGTGKTTLMEFNRKKKYQMIKNLMIKQFLQLDLMHGDMNAKNSLQQLQ